jgi:hypothetical protein
MLQVAFADVLDFSASVMGVGRPLVVDQASIPCPNAFHEPLP